MSPKKSKNLNDPKTWIDYLPSLEGKRYMYMGTVERILHHELQGSDVMVKTDHRTRVLTFSKLQEFIPALEEVDETVPAVVSAEVMQHQEQQLNPFKTLEDVLMDNINKVIENPEFATQGQVVNKSVSMFIQAQRTKLEFMRFLKNQKD